MGSCWKPVDTESQLSGGLVRKEKMRNLGSHNCRCCAFKKKKKKLCMSLFDNRYREPLLLLQNLWFERSGVVWSGTDLV